MKNVAHMTKIHSFFIPDTEYLSDLKGTDSIFGTKSWCWEDLLMGKGSPFTLGSWASIHE